MLNQLTILFTVMLFAGFAAKAQQDLSGQIPKAKRYTPFEVIDQRYGIIMYEKLNKRLGGDSVRNCRGYSCSGWIEDYYVNGKLLHRGYYVDGQLKIYKNFFPNGQQEREFKVVDDYRSTLRVFHGNSNLKSQVKYISSDASEWTDFYENGNIEYHEQYHKSFEYYIVQKSNYENGTPESILELVNKKKLIFDKREYHKNGKIKLYGQLIYSEDLFDYQKIGKWQTYDETSRLTHEETWERGEKVKDKDY
ncbi:MAG: hypothetical protein COA57_10585 [Flavobacteriales bacterium]|nr:MAG: hypothetical protein COA57_10585 [Flavobacteriales bacterium]